MAIGLAYEVADGSNSRIVGHLELWTIDLAVLTRFGFSGFSIADHRAKLHAGEGLPVQAFPFVREEDRAAVVELDEECDCNADGGGDRQDHQCEADVEEAFEERVDRTVTCSRADKVGDGGPIRGERSLCLFGRHGQGAI